MASIYEKNGKTVGIHFPQDYATLMKQGGSTDMGNVSQVIPSIHPKFSLNTLSSLHTTEFRDIASKWLCVRLR